MRLLLLLAIFGLGLQPPVPVPAQITSSIQVIVLTDGTDAPIADVEVMIGGPIADPQRSTSQFRRSKTTAAGLAEFDSLPLGDYLVTVQRDGYLSAMRVSGGPILPSAAATATLSLSTADSQAIVFYFRPAGSISGRALDPDRKPIPNARVSALVQIYSFGHRAFLEGSVTTTDSEGAYRLKQLGAGNYYVRLHIAENGFDVYHPSVIEADRATSVVLRNGDNITGIELATPSIRTFKVSGTVINSPGPVSSFTFATTSRADLPGTEYPSLSNRVANSSREFEISGVPSGSWDLFSIVPLEGTGVDPVQAISRPNATGRTHIEVIDRDVDGVVLVIGSATVQGRVNFQGAVPDASVNLQGVRIALIPEDNIPPPLLKGTAMEQTPDDGGLFLFPYLPLGAYSFSVVTQFQGWYVADVRQGPRSIFDRGRITVGADPVELLEIDLRPGGGTIKGTLDESTAPDRGDDTEALIALVPQSQFQRDNLTLYKTTTLIGGSGGFTFHNVAPGNYRVIAWKSVPPGDPSKNAEFVARYESRGAAVSVKADETASVQVQLIPEGNRARRFLGGLDGI